MVYLSRKVTMKNKNWYAQQAEIHLKAWQACIDMGDEEKAAQHEREYLNYSKEAEKQGAL